MRPITEVLILQNKDGEKFELNDISYLCLFLCLQTHCCHLEMATSLDVSGFMNALVRMTARRGWPKKMLSDNGTNFAAAEKEIRALVAQLDQKQIESDCEQGNYVLLESARSTPLRWSV